MSVNWSREPGFPKPPQNKKPEDPWGRPPWSNMSGFATERCVLYVLIDKFNMVMDVDFLFQKRIPVRGINQTGLNRSDFWVLPNGKGAMYGVGGIPYYYGRIINPIASTALIHNPNKDRLERQLIRAAHYDIIYILDHMLYAAPFNMVEDALRGIDHSGR